MCGYVAAGADWPFTRGNSAFSPLMEVVSDCCREGCGGKVSRHSGSAHSAHLVQSALYCKSLLINLMPLVELHSRLESVTKKRVSKHAAHIIREHVGAAAVALRWKFVTRSFFFVDL